ncbi:response regulator [Rhizobium cauense]|uniref:response regulator n=1 Tax=Rhizobium cauense TaxID=1166683 RepID=UPI001C6E4159|nr:response regulator [Rhizobium cauense]MBW9115616.1 response regulator [Rhizobium cauense]
MDDRLPGKTILVVEAGHFLATDLLSAFVDCGTTIVGPIAKVHLALEIIATEYIDAAILDLRVSAEDAFSIAEALSAREVPFVFASSEPRLPTPARFDGYRLVSKPLEFYNVVEALFGPM